MNITNLFKDFTLLAGAEWVMWILVALSILSVGVMIERGLFLSARKIDAARLAADVKQAFAEGTLAKTRDKYKGSQAMAAVVACEALTEADRGVEPVSELMNSIKVRERRAYEKYLIILGTLGNNAPFIGLFGTVLGVIKAFHDLSEDAEGGTDVVMTGISEALVATAVGLLVAIPAVIAFNYFNRRVRDAVTETDELAHAILGELHAHADRGAA